MVGINSAGGLHIVLWLKTISVCGTSTLNCMENVGRRVGLRQPTLWTVPVDRCVDRR